MKDSGLEINSESAILHILTHRPQRIEQFFFDPHKINARVAELLNLAKSKNVPTSTFHGGAFGAAKARLKPFQYSDLKTWIAPQVGRATLLALDHIQDPQNFGAICRSADAFSAKGVLIPKDRAALVTTGVYAASVGTVETVPVFLVTNLAESLRRLKKAGFWIVGLGANETKVEVAQDFEKTVIVVGSELSGISPLVARECDLFIKIPMTGLVESLNVSVATGIYLYEQNKRDPAAK